MSEVVDLLVIGAGPAGRVAALEAAKLGLEVVLLAEPERPEGALCSGSLGDLAQVDFGAESFAETGATAKLARELGVALESLGPRRSVLVTEHGSARLSDEIRAGVPANPFAPELRPLLRGSTLRAYADRVMPYLQIGDERNLARLVGGRLGRGVLEKLTRPFTRALWALEPEAIDAELAIPGVSAALTRFGSLQGAIAGLDSGPSGDVRCQDGASALAVALGRELENYAVRTIPARAIAVSQLELEWTVALAASEPLRARTVIVAADPAGLGLERPSAIEPLERERLVLSALVRWDAPPSAAGIEPTGALLADGAVSGLARPASRSARLAAELPAGTDLLRATINPEALGPLEPAEALGAAAERAFGSRAEVLESRAYSWPVMRPWLAAGDPVRGRRQGADDGSLELAGAWAAGSGLDAAVRSGHEVAHRVRRIALERKLQAAEPNA